jgi:hypothetical protein
MHDIFALFLHPIAILIRLGRPGLASASLNSGYSAHLLQNLLLGFLLCQKIHNPIPELRKSVRNQKLQESDTVG